MDQDDGPGPAADFRRRVLFIPGYDPFPPRRYRELYRSEGAEQAALSGYELSIRARKGETDGWQATAQIDGKRVETKIEVLVWSDLVRGSMARGILGTYGLLLRTAWVYGRSGALWRLLRLRKGPMIAALYPAVLLILQALAALAAGALAAGALVAGIARGLPWGLPWGLGLALGALVVWAVLEGFRRLDRRLLVYYLMHDYAFTGCRGGAYPPVLAARLAAFAARLRAALDGGVDGGVDEVLVVAHSSGVHLAVSVLADAIRGGLPEPRPALAFLSLGQAVPMASFLPGAGRLRGDLAYLAAREELTWVDVSAPADGCSFALCDPVAVTGVAPDNQRWPLVISAAFSQTLSPARWQALRRRYFRLHFQYLHAFDNLPGRQDDYDYFRITAGPLTLARRFADRRPSASRISRASNPYRSLS